MKNDKIIASSFTNELGNEIGIQVSTPERVNNPAETVQVSMQCPTSDTDWIMTEKEAKELMYLLQLYFR